MQLAVNSSPHLQLHENYNHLEDDEILLPKDENEEEYNPLAKGEAMTTQDLAESIDKLKKL